MANSSLQTRLDNVFGSLHARSEESNQPPPWKPTEHNIFRSGAIDNEIDQDFATIFPQHIDNECEIDHYEALVYGGGAFQALDQFRPPLLTPLSEEDDDEAFGGLAPMDEDNDHHDASKLHKPTFHRAISPITSTRHSRLKSNLRRGPRPEGGTVKKKVSFTGLPEAYVPPHRRHTSNGTISTSVTATARNNKVPDHEVNPQRYKRYDLGTSILVGGGVAQLLDDLEEEENDNGKEEKEEERWQGEVGKKGVVQFTRKEPSEGASFSRRKDTETSTSIVPACTAAEEEEKGEEEDYHHNGDDVAAKQQRRQYRPQSTTLDAEDVEEDTMSD